MSIGAPSTLGTLLIQRLDAVLGTTLGQQANLVSGAHPAAVTQPGSTENPGALQNPAHRDPREAVDAAGGQGRGQAAIGKPSGASALDDRMGRAATYHSATASAPTTLGYAARIILALLAQHPDAGPPPRGRAPLIGTPSGAAGAGLRPGSGPHGAGDVLRSTPAPGGALSGSAGTTGTAATGPSWATLAGALDQPGALAARFAQSLARAVQTTGLFYESHLAQLAFGKASAQDLAQEPQARLGAGLGTADAGGRAAGAAARAAQPAQAAGPSVGPQAAAAPSGPAPTPAGMPASDPGGNPAQAAPSPQAPIPGIDPQAQPMVRQQLEVLANQAFAWQGQAWPGADMRWQVERHPGDAQGGDDAATHWSTRLDLSLPNLGSVQARLTLAGDQLMLRLVAPDSADRLDAHAEALRSRLLAQGLQPGQLSISARGQAPAEAPSFVGFPNHGDTHPPA